MDGGAWWAAVYGIAKSWTRLSDFTFTFHFMHWRSKWQPTPVFLPGESQGLGSLVGCCLWGRTESDTTEATLAAAAAADGELNQAVPKNKLVCTWEKYQENKMRCPDLLDTVRWLEEQ